MQTKSLRTFYFYIFKKADGSSYKLYGGSELGKWEIKYALEKKYGIVASESTIYQRAKTRSTKTFPLLKYGYLKTKEELLAFGNWALFIAKSNKTGNTFTEDINYKKAFINNPFVSVELAVTHIKEV